MEARPAKFGQSAATWTGTGVRDTRELPPCRLTLGGSGWSALLDGALEHFRDELGLLRSARLRTESHAMRLYGKGSALGGPFCLQHPSKAWWEYPA